MALLIFASAHNFLTPVGCSQNMIAAAAGNYSFSDCLKSGWVLQLLMLPATVGSVYAWIVLSEAGGVEV